MKKNYKTCPNGFSIHGRGGVDWFDCETLKERDEWEDVIKEIIRSKYS